MHCTVDESLLSCCDDRQVCYFVMIVLPIGHSTRSVRVLGGREHREDGTAGRSILRSSRVHHRHRLENKLYLVSVRMLLLLLL